MKHGKVLIVVIIGIAAAALVSFGVLRVLPNFIVVRAGSEHLVWDFQKDGFSPAAVHWPGSASGPFFDIKGEFDLRIINKQGVEIFHDQVQHIICERKGNDFDGITLHFGSGSSAEEAYETAKSLMKRRGYEPSRLNNLEKWHSGIASRMSYPEFCSRFSHDRYFDFGSYPGFSDIGVRISVVGGRPEDGTCRCVLTWMFSLN